MALRLGLGPVFGIECVAAARRWQLYVGRFLFVSLLLLGMWTIWESAGDRVMMPSEVRQIANQFTNIVIAAQLLMVMLLAPAVAAGSICVDKARGTLHHVFVTDLSNREIILGKLGTRLLSVLAMMACCAPVLALGGLLGGLDYEMLLRAYVITAGVGVLACSLTLFVSIFVRKPHQALVPTYALLGAWSAAILFWNTFSARGTRPALADLEGFVALANPYLAVVATYTPDDPLRWSQPLAFLVGTFSLSVLLVSLSITWLRKVVIRQENRPKKAKRADAPLRILEYLPGPPLDGNAVLWREWHRRKPGMWAGRAWTLYAVLSLAATGVMIFLYYTGSNDREVIALASRVNTAEVVVGLILLTISSTTALAEERDRGSLDIILTTPLETATILRGKWLGSFAMVPRLAILPIWMTAGMALITGDWLAPLVMVGLILAYSAVIVSLGLALATWIPRVGRAIACGLLVVILLNGALFLAYSLFYRRAGLGQGGYLAYQNDDQFWLGGMMRSPDWLLLGSPLYGVSETTRWAGTLPWLVVDDSPFYFYGKTPGHGAAGLWIAALAGLAASLLFATIATFDRCLGRMTTHQRLDAPPRSAPVPASKPLAHARR